MDITLKIETLISKYEHELEGFKYTFVFTFLVGLVVHMVVIALGLHNHDSIVLPYSNGDWLISQGKWFVTPFSALDGVYDIYYLSGIIGIAAYSLSAGLITIVTKIYDKRVLSLVGLSIIASPSVATTLIYHGADYFGGSFLFAVFGACLVIHGGILLNVVGTMIVCLSIGGYQANVSVALMVYLVDIFIKIANENEDIKKIVCRICKYIISTAFSTGLYYIILKIIVRVQGIELSDYKGINNIGSILSPQSVISSSVDAYKNFVSYFCIDALGIYSGKMFIWGCFFLGISIITCILCILVKIAEHKSLYAIVYGILFFLGIPLCANAIGILSQNSSFYQITVEPFCLTIVLQLVFAYTLLCNENAKEKRYIYLSVFLCTFFSTLLLNWSWIKENNTVYQEMKIINNSYDAKLTALVSRIQGTEGYDNNSEIVLVGEVPFPFLSSSGVLNSYESQLYTNGYGFTGASSEIYNEGILESFLTNKYSINLNIDSSDSVILTDREIIDQMPVYPAANSIKNVNGQIIIKLSENY